MLIALNHIIYDVQRFSHDTVSGVSNQSYNQEFLQNNLILILINSIGQ
jgi:hypothetical protein